MPTILGVIAAFLAMRCAYWMGRYEGAELHIDAQDKELRFLRHQIAPESAKFMAEDDE